MRKTERRWLAIIGVGTFMVLALVVMAAALAVPWSSGFRMMGWDWGWAVAMMVLPVVLVIILLPVILYATSNVSPALDILCARYARGEISWEEFLGAEKDLLGRRTWGA